MQTSFLTTPLNDARFTAYCEVLLAFLTSFSNVIVRVSYEDPYYRIVSDDFMIAPSTKHEIKHSCFR